jgi:type IV secretion system protein TrbG
MKPHSIFSVKYHTNLFKVLAGCLAVCLAGAAAPVFAQSNNSAVLKAVGKSRTETSVASPLDSRVVVFPFNKDGIYDILTRTQRFTRLEFAPNETVKAFFISDMIQWEYHVSADKRNIMVKPIQQGISTTATVVTTERTYDLDFTEIKSESKLGWMQRVSWTQPIKDPSQAYFDETGLLPSPSPTLATNGAARREALASPCNGASLNQRTGYKIENNTAFFSPTHIWDDGRYTCIALPASVQEIPALFALDSQGQTELVDYKFIDGVLVAPRVLGYGAVLKLGKEEVRISGRTPTTASSRFRAASVSLSAGDQ